MDAGMLYGLGIFLIFAGMLVVLVAVLLLFISHTKGKVEGSGAIIIGPFPIIFGTNKESVKTILLLSLSLTIILVIVMVIFHFILE